DRVGNSATATASVSIDVTPPVVDVTLSPPPTSTGVYTTPVTAHFTCHDVLSGVTGCPADQIFSTPGEKQTASATVADRAGNIIQVVSPPFTIQTPAQLVDPDTLASRLLTATSVDAKAAVIRDIFRALNVASYRGEVNEPLVSDVRRDVFLFDFELQILAES